MPRRSIASETDPLAQRPGRDREWEQKQRDERGQVSYRGIPRSLQEQIKALAAELHITTGEVARCFIEYGLEAYRTGELDMEPQAVETRFSLYPDELRKMLGD